MWRYLQLYNKGPKIHSLEDHLVNQMEVYNSIGDFLEDFIELAHQYGVKEENRTRGLGRCKAYKSHSDWKWKLNQLAITNTKQEIAKKTSRRRCRGRVDSLVRKKNKRMKNRLDSLERVESGIYS